MSDRVEGIGRMVVPWLGRAGLILNGRVNQSRAIAAPRAVLHRTRRGRAATVRASLHREVSPGLGAAPPVMRGSRPAIGDRHAAQADSPRGPGGSTQAGAATEA